MLLFIFIIIALPAIGLASRNHSEIWSFDMDENILMPNIQRALSFEYPKFTGPYGSVPYFICVFIFLPIAILFKVNSLTFSFSQAALMFHVTQLCVSCLSIIYLYKIGQLLKSKLVSIISSLAVVLCSANWIWTLNIHPDIFQSSFLIVSVYYCMLLLSKEESIMKVLIYSSFFLGLSIGSKFWGVFLIPGIVFAILFKFKSRFIKGLKFSFYFIAFSFIIFALFNLQFIIQFDDVVLFFAQMKKLKMNVGFNPFSNYDYKISNFTSPLFFGEILIIYFLISSVYFAKQWLRKKDIILLPIFFSFYFFMVFYFVFYNDPINTHNGERYIIGFILLMFPPVFIWLDRLYKENSKYSFFSLILISFFCIIHIIRILGIKTEYLNIVQRYEASSLFSHLNRFYQRENTVNFSIRKWITSNVKKGDMIYVEYYLNLTDNHSDNADLPDVNILMDSKIDIKRIQSVQPDFAISKDDFLDSDLILLKNYTKEIYSPHENDIRYNKLYILKKKYNLVTNVYFNFYESFSMCEKINLYEIDAPWKNSLSTLNQNNFIFSLPESTLSCNFQYNSNNKLYLTGNVGYWPGAKNWNVSDGVRARIDIFIDSNNKIEVLNAILLPQDNPIDFSFPLSKYRNKKIKINLSITNDIGKNLNGDWIVWEDPKIVTK